MWTKSFFEYLEFERNYSQKTIIAYRGDLEAFESFCKETDAALTWETVDSDVVRNWVVAMMEAGNVATTVNRRLSALRTFYRYLLKRGWVKADPVRTLLGPKKTKPLPSFLRESEINKLLDGEGYFAEGFVGERDKLIVNMFYVTGMRLSELTGLNESDVDLRGRVVRVTGKRNKQRIIPFGDELESAVRHYLHTKREVGLAEGGAMFVDKAGLRLSGKRVEADVKNYLGMVTTLKKKSPHVLRHTFATSMLNHHADLETLRELLGHESVSTTEVYTHTTFEELKEMYNQAHPRA